MLEITSSQLKEFCQTSTELVARVTDVFFDIEKYKNEVLSIVKEHPPQKKDNESKYSALGLQYADVLDQYYDSIAGVFYVNEHHELILNSRSIKLWNNWNNLGERLSELYRPIYNIGLELFRTRILVADPGHDSIRHVDYDWRYHIPITTNEHCYLEYGNGEKIHLPADGHAYVVNAGFMHKFCNLGNTTRYHYCGIINIKNPGDGILNVDPLL